MTGKLYSLSLVALILLSAGCTESREHQGEHVTPTACKMRGNGDTPPICNTSFSAILARPDKFNGLHVSIGAWVDGVNDAIILFPSKEAWQSRDSFSSVVIYPVNEPNLPNGVQISNLPSGDARFVRVTGTFHWVQDGVRDKRIDPLDADRLGLLEGVKIDL